MSAPGISKMTEEQTRKASYYARRIQKDMRCSNDEAMRVAIEWVEKFGTV